MVSAFALRLVTARILQIVPFTLIPIKFGLSPNLMGAGEFPSREGGKLKASQKAGEKFTRGVFQIL
jgi:hypothetical protein